VNLLDLAKVSTSTAPILLTHIFNSSDLIILYNACTCYINVILKEYPYLSLYNSDRFQNKYEFKNLDICLRYKKEYNKRKLVSQIINDSYNIKYLFTSCRKKIKINISLKIEESILITLNNYDKIVK
jgi:hypothetical protein